MEPDRRLNDYIWPLPGIPGQVRLGFSRDESPVDRSYVLLLGDRQHRVKGASLRARHVFGANDRAIVFPQPLHLTPEVLRPGVDVKGDDVGFAQLNLLQFPQLGAVAGVVHSPYSAGERLAGVHFSRPLEDLWQKSLYPAFFVFELTLWVDRHALRPRLIPQVPPEDALIAGECLHHTLDVFFQPGILLRVGQRQCSRTLHPTGIMDSRNGRMLRTKARERVPAGIEQYQQRADVMPRSDGQELVDATLKS